MGHLVVNNEATPTPCVVSDFSGAFEGTCASIVEAMTNIREDDTFTEYTVSVLTEELHNTTFTIDIDNFILKPMSGPYAINVTCAVHDHPGIIITAANVHIKNFTVNGCSTGVISDKQNTILENGVLQSNYLGADLSSSTQASLIAMTIEHNGVANTVPSALKAVGAEDIQVSNSFIHNNIVPSCSGENTLKGGGIVIDASSIVFANSKITDNGFDQSCCNEASNLCLGLAFAGFESVVTFEENCVISSNDIPHKTADYGGLLYFTTGSTVTFDDTTVEGGDALYEGGCVFAGGSTINMISSTFDECMCAGKGGAFKIKDSNLILETSTIKESVAGRGGAIYAESILKTVNISLSDSHIDENNFLEEDKRVVASEGAGVYFNGPGTITCTGASTIARNGQKLAGSYGGALYAEDNSVVSIDSCRFENNKAANGGAVATKSDLSLKFCTFDSNEADNDGGAIFARSNTAFVEIEGGVYKQNTAKYGGALDVHGLSLTAATFEENEATANGGAVHANNYDTDTDLDFFISSAIFTQNEALQASAIYLKQRNTNFKNSTLSSNIFKKNVGASAVLIDDESMGYLKIVANHFIENVYDNKLLGVGTGGSSANTSPPVQSSALEMKFSFGSAKQSILSNNLFALNYGVKGGAISSFNGNFLTFDNNKFISNSATSWGGAVALHKVEFDSSVSFRDNIFDLNTAASSGGGLYAEVAFPSTTVLTSSKFYRNKAAYGGGISIKSLSDAPEKMPLVVLSQPEFGRNVAVTFQECAQNVYLKSWVRMEMNGPKIGCPLTARSNVYCDKSTPVALWKENAESLGVDMCDTVCDCPHTPTSCDERCYSVLKLNCKGVCGGDIINHCNDGTVCPTDKPIACFFEDLKNDYKPPPVAVTKSIINFDLEQYERDEGAPTDDPRVSGSYLPEPDGCDTNSAMTALPCAATVAECSDLSASASRCTDTTKYYCASTKTCIPLNSKCTAVCAEDEDVCPDGLCVPKGKKCTFVIPKCKFGETRCNGICLPAGVTCDEAGCNIEGEILCADGVCRPKKECEQIQYNGCPHGKITCVNEKCVDFEEECKGKCETGVGCWGGTCAEKNGDCEPAPCARKIIGGTLTLSKSRESTNSDLAIPDDSGKPIFELNVKHSIAGSATDNNALNFYSVSDSRIRQAVHKHNKKEIGTSGFFSAVVQLTLEESIEGEFTDPVELRFRAMIPSGVSVSDLCLGFSRGDDEWECEPGSLVVDEERTDSLSLAEKEAGVVWLYSQTKHFTDFGVILTSEGSEEETVDEDETGSGDGSDVIVWIIVGCVAGVIIIAILIVAIVAIVVIASRAKKRVGRSRSSTTVNFGEDDGMSWD